MLPDVYETVENVEYIRFFEPFISFDFPLNGHFQSVVKVFGINFQANLFNAHLQFYLIH